VIALFVVGIVTYERAKHRRVSLSCARRQWLPHLITIPLHRTSGSSSLRKLAPEWDMAQRRIGLVTGKRFLGCRAQDLAKAINGWPLGVPYL